MLSYIPKRLAVYLIKKEFEDEVSELKKHDIYYQLSNDNSKYLYQAYIFPLKEANYDRTLYLSNHLGIDRDKYELVVFDNSEIKIKLNLRKTQYRAYDTRYCLELHHSSFEGRKYQPYICISCRDFLNILNKYEINLVDSELSGVFKIKIMNLGTFPNYSIVSEDFIDSDRFLKWSVDYYDLCTTTKHTSKWIPGHIYSLKNRSIFLYLGLGKDITRYKASWWGDYSTDLIELFTNNKLKDIINYSSLKKKDHTINYDNVKIVVPLSQEQLNSLLMFEGKRLTIKDFIKGVISVNPKFFNNIGYHTGLCYFKNNKPLVAMDLGKYIDIVDINETNIYPEIVDYVTEGIINSNSEEIIEDFKIFSKDDIIKLINSNEKYRDLFMLSLLKEESYGLKILVSELPTANTNPGITGKELIDSVLNIDTLNIKLSTFVKESISNLQGIIKAFLSNNPIKDFKISDFYKLTEDFIKNL